MAKDPGRSIAEYVHDPAFRRSLGTGAASGAVAGLVAFGVTAALPAAGSLWGAIGVGVVSGALAGGAGQVTANLLTPCTPWHQGVLETMAWGGVAAGGRLRPLAVVGRQRITSPVAPLRHEQEQGLYAAL